MKFAKLFDVNENTQVVVMKEFDDDAYQDTPHLIKIVTDYNGIYLVMIHGFKEESKRDEKFDQFDLNIAAQVFSQIVELVEEPDKEFEEDKS